MVSNEIHSKLELILREMEQEFIMMQFKFTAGNDLNKVIYDVPGIGTMNTHLHRDKLVMGIIREKMAKLNKLLHYPRAQITQKRMVALRQHYFLLVYKNIGIKRMYNKNWSERSATFCAGKFLIAIFDKHISYRERARD